VEFYNCTFWLWWLLNKNLWFLFLLVNALSEFLNPFVMFACETKCKWKNTLSFENTLCIHFGVCACQSSQQLHNSAVLLIHLAIRCERGACASTNFSPKWHTTRGDLEWPNDWPTLAEWQTTPMWRSSLPAWIKCKLHCAALFDNPELNRLMSSLWLFLHDCLPISPKFCSELSLCPNMSNFAVLLPFVQDLMRTHDETNMSHMCVQMCMQSVCLLNDMCNSSWLHLLCLCWLIWCHKHQLRGNHCSATQMKHFCEWKLPQCLFWHCPRVQWFLD